ncbi:MAG: glycosyltransferase family 39 protein, partial [Candidatus Kapaibacterium sp.]
MGRTTTAPRGARTGLDGLLASPWAYALLALAAAIVYWQAPKYPLGRFDEDSILMPNMEYLVKTATVGDVIMRDAFFRPTGKVFYRPVQNVSYLIDARIGKGKASTFTVTSIVLHALCCILLLVLLRQVGVRFGISPTFAFVLALFFTVNPLFVQAVAWTPGRGDLLLALFALGALVSYHRYCSDGSALWLSACGVLTTLAIFSKETGIVMLVLLPLWWLLMERDRTSVRHMLLGVAPGIIAAAVMFAMRAKIITEPTTTADFALVNLLSNLRVFPEISAKLFAPPLLQTMAGYTMLCTILGGIVLLGLGAASLVRGETSSRATALYGLAWYGAFLLPGALYTHRFGSAAYDYLEHRGYVPAIGLALVLFIVLGRLLRNVQPRIVTAAGGIVVVVFAALAMGHVRDFASATTFYDQTVRTNPASALARANRGQMRQAAGDIQGAMDD